MKLSTLIDQLLKIQNEMDTDPEVSMNIDLFAQLQDRVGEVIVVHDELVDEFYAELMDKLAEDD